MIKNNLGESLVGIIIGVFILSFIILGVTNLLINSKGIINTYENKKIVSIIKNNTSVVIKKIDTSKVRETEVFYLYKNSITNNYEVFTGTINSKYKYIDKNGYLVNNINNFNGPIYSRFLWVERADNSIGSEQQIIKSSISKLIKK